MPTSRLRGWFWIDRERVFSWDTVTADADPMPRGRRSRVIHGEAIVESELTVLSEQQNSGGREHLAGRA